MRGVAIILLFALARNAGEIKVLVMFIEPVGVDYRGTVNAGYQMEVCTMQCLAVYIIWSAKESTTLITKCREE